MWAPSWLDRTEYPFDSHTLELDAGRLHYLDQGHGPPIVFVHGTPVWSFLYRNQIKALSRSYRCIALDHLGFGLSEKPVNGSYRPADHARNLRTLIERLDLRDITLVIHDFGGPIGSAYALDCPDNVVRMVVMNTWMWPLNENREAKQISTVMATGLGRFLYERLNFSARYLIPAVSGDHKLSRPIHDQYVNAAPDPQARHAMWVLACELIGSSEWYASLWERRERIRQIPALLLWGLKDRGVQSGVFDLARWQTVFAQQRTVTYAGSGHFVAEEMAAQVTAEIAAFMEQALPTVKYRAGVGTSPIHADSPVL